MPNFKGLDDLERLNFICTTRSYYKPAEIKKLNKKKINNYNDAILAIIDYEFGEKFKEENYAMYTEDEFFEYDDIKKEFYSILPSLEKDYLLARKDKEI
jgi:hypothetical protein